MKDIFSVAFALIFFDFGAFEATSQEAFVVLQGQDTITVERFLRERDKLQGKLLVKKQQIPISFEAELGTDQSLEEILISAFQAGASVNAEPLQQGTLKFRKDQIFAITHQGGTIKKDTFQTKTKALTYHSGIPIISLLEQIVLYAKLQEKKEVNVPVFFMSSNGKTAAVNVQFPQQDSAKVRLGNTQVDLKLNERGEILFGSTRSGLKIFRKKSVPDAALATTPPDYSAPPNAPYTSENVTVQTAAGHTLAGTLSVPKHASKPVPVVITITGSSPQDRDHNTPFGGNYNIYRHLADTLGKEGVAVLRMDDRGIGRSTGDFATATTAERANDIREGIEFVRQQNELDSQKIFLVGLSEGAVIANMIAAENDNLRGIVHMAGPVSTGREVMKYQLEQSLSIVDSLSQSQKKELLKKKISELEAQSKEDPWLDFFLSYDPAATAANVEDVPVLILQGSTDKNVPPQDAKKLKEILTSAGNEDVTLKIFENLNHIFIKDPNGHPQNYSELESLKVAPQVYAVIVEWIKERD